MGSVAAETSDFRRIEVAGQYQQCPVGMTLMGSNGRLWSAASEGLGRYRVDSLNAPSLSPITYFISDPIVTRVPLNVASSVAPKPVNILGQLCNRFCTSRTDQHLL